jgi:hypothetical protein
MLTEDGGREGEGAEGVVFLSRPGAWISGIHSHAWIARSSAILLLTGQIPQSLKASQIIRWLNAFSHTGLIIHKNSDFPAGSPAQYDSSLFTHQKCCL